MVSTMTDRPDPRVPRPTHTDSPYIAADPSWWNTIQGTLLQFDFDGFPPYEAVLTNTAGALSGYHMSGVRVTRLGGIHPADAATQRNLFTLLGAITLAAGHVELEMKRILLTANAVPESGFADVDYTWKGLEDRLTDVAAGDGPLAEALGPVLAWSADKKLRERRNDAVHSAWWLFDVGHFEGSRLAYRSDGASILDDGQGLAETAALLREYLNRLQRVVRWPMLVLPPLGEDVPIRQYNVEVRAEGD